MSADQPYNRRSRWHSALRLLCAGTIFCGWLLCSEYSLAQEFDAIQFKAKVVASYQSEGAPVLVEELANQFEALGLSHVSDVAAVRRFYSNLINELKFSPADGVEAERAYLDVVSRFLAGRDVWSTENTKQATDQLGRIALQLRQSNLQEDSRLVAVIDDAVSKADNMYISALRYYDPDEARMRAVIEQQLIPLLNLDYVKPSAHFASIRAMISAKYFELALLEADYDRPICSPEAKLDKQALQSSAKYARELLLDIDAGKVPSAIGVRNDLIYQLLQLAALSCDRPSLLEYAKLLARQQPVGAVEEIADQVYVFRHLRTKRITTSKLVWVKTDKGDEQITRTKPDQSDVVRGFFNPWQISAYLCKVVLSKPDLSVKVLKADLDTFENVDFWVTVELPGKSSKPRISLVQQMATSFERKRAEIVTQIKRKMGDQIGASATQRILSDVSVDECGAFRAFPPNPRYDSILTAANFRLVPMSGEGKQSGKLRIGGYFSFDEAKVIRDTLREIFPSWSVTLGRPRISS